MTYKRSWFSSGGGAHAWACEVCGKGVREATHGSGPERVETPYNANQLTCSPECARARKTALQKERRKQLLDELTHKIQELQGKINRSSSVKHTIAMQKQLQELRDEHRARRRGKAPKKRRDPEPAPSSSRRDDPLSSGPQPCLSRRRRGSSST